METYRIGPIMGIKKTTKNHVNLSVAVSNLFFKTSITAIRNRIKVQRKNNGDINGK